MFIMKAFCTLCVLVLSAAGALGLSSLKRTLKRIACSGMPGKAL